MIVPGLEGLCSGSSRNYSPIDLSGKLVPVNATYSNLRLDSMRDLVTRCKLSYNRQRQCLLEQATKYRRLTHLVPRQHGGLDQTLFVHVLNKAGIFATEISIAIS
jgi:5-methylcytosine-specific restriction endonuclease McrA